MTDIDLTKVPKPNMPLLQAILARGRCAYLDTETTGTNPNIARAVQVALLHDDGQVLINSLVRTPDNYCIPREAIAIHGITDAMCRIDGYPWGDVFQRLMTALTSLDLDLIIYNAGYDVPLITNTCRIYGVDPAPWLDYLKRRPPVCAMLAYAEVRGEWNDYRGNWRWHRLPDAAVYEGFSDDGAHDALVDCRNTRLVCHKRFEPPKIEQAKLF